MDKRAIIAGHVCIDITPTIPDLKADKIEKVMQPGKLISIGKAELTLGGAVSNTGIAMKFFGVDVSAMGKIGDDPFGDIVYEQYKKHGLEKGLIVSKGAETSYSVVVAIPGIDRVFLHDSGANDTYCYDDIPWDKVEGASLFHFGYPPLMRMMYDNGSAEMMKILKKAQECGAATSLDMAAVDPDAPVGHVDWDKYLTEVIPYVDFFVPSIEELCYMIDRDRFQEWKERADGRDVCMILDPEKDIKPLADECMKRGAKVLFLKCGAPGAYLCTANEDVLKKIPSALGFDAKIWANQTIFEKSYKPEKVLSGTGAGDTSIAAFLSSILKGYSPQTAMQMAAGTGASCVEDYGALGGLRTFDELKTKIANGWEKNNFF